MPSPERRTVREQARSYQKPASRLSGSGTERFIQRLRQQAKIFHATRPVTKAELL